MLRVEKTTLGTFGEPELEGLINSRGWKSVLPDALDDQRLLLISDQPHLPLRPSSCVQRRAHS